jgi:hypothetical protein
MSVYNLYYFIVSKHTQVENEVMWSYVDFRFMNV